MSCVLEPDSLGYLIADTARLLRLAFERRIGEAGLGITAGEAWALLQIECHNGQRQTFIADRMGIEPMTLCTYVDRLERVGLVSRDPDPSDRRAKLLRTTAKAEEMLSAIRAQSAALIDDIQQGLDPIQREILTPAVKALRSKLQERLNLCCGARGELQKAELKECMA